jgi:hypothetical protein
VSRPLARYTPSRRYLLYTLLALGGAVLSAWLGVRWEPSWIASALFGLTAIGLASITLRPVIEIHEDDLRVGGRQILWSEIRRVDSTAWTAPLAVHLTLSDGERLMVLYPGEAESASSLLQHLRRHSREALIDGVPYKQFWGEIPRRAESAAPRSAINADAAPKYPVLRPEDEEEVERLFQKLKAVGRLESKNSDED